MNMNAVGIDVSKGKSMVAILRPYGEIVSSPFEIKHTSSTVSYTHLEILWTGLQCGFIFKPFF